MERWHIPTIEADGRREPRVLFSTPQCRAVVLDLRAGERLGDHGVHERAVLQVVSGDVVVRCGDQDAACGAGTLITFAPDERHGVEAASDARLLLLLAPWPGDGHYPDGVEVDATRMPAHATADPIS